MYTSISTWMINICTISLVVECDKGLYYDPIKDNCVSECPCGLIGDSYTWQCWNGKQPAKK